MMNRSACARLFVAALIGAPILGALAIRPAAAQIVFDKPTFLADPRVGATTTENFDGLATGTDLTGQTSGNATFTAPGSGPLLVIAGATGVRFPMSPSSGANVLSPGGSDPSLENDDLVITFATPVQAAGIDVVFDVPDGASFVGVTFLDALGATIDSNGFIPSPSGAPGFQFVGLVSNTANIKSIVFDEFDGSANDDNVAYDTLVYTGSQGTAAPEPGTVAFALLGLPLAASVLRRRRK